ncbi:perlucin-like protein [Mercenaria mercenaria]|uniref:perlucin-like protein n=1 Tax=Mercenaria mercenaria TaxID=6596 RepID=UPI00234E6927|nr:perlucin-like protein [Mercenaria mercenaria]
MEMANLIFCLTILSACYTAGVSCCSVGWEAHGDSCYHFSHDSETWTGAWDFCRILKGKLVEINSPQENIYLESQAKRLNKTFWIGLTDILQDGTFVWMDSSTPLTSSGFSDWAPGEPNNFVQGEESCVALYQPLGFRWTDAPCNFASPHFICEKDNPSTQPVG